MEARIGSPEIHHLNTREINKTRRRFSRIVRSLPSEKQDFITEMTSILTEPDIYNKFRSNPDEVTNFKKELTNMGLGEDKIKVIFNYFNLPYSGKENGK